MDRLQADTVTGTEPAPWWILGLGGEFGHDALRTDIAATVSLGVCTEPPRQTGAASEPWAATTGAVLPQHADYCKTDFGSATPS